MATAIQIAAPFLGAALLEATHWYQLREENLRPKYLQMLKSVRYWVTTAVFTVLAPLAILIAFGDQSATQLLILGASAPTVIKKLISASTEGSKLKLGTDDEKPSLLDYFRTGG